MKKYNNLKITKNIGILVTASIVGFNLANFSSKPVKARAENYNDITYLTEMSLVASKSIALPTNPTNTLEYTKATEDNLLGDASNWNGFVLGNVTSAIDFEGSIAVRGDLNANGLTVNSVANDVYHKQTDDISLLVGGDININGYGSVFGNTATSSENVTNYNLSNVTESSPTSQGKYLVVDSEKYFEDAEKVLKEANQTLSSKEANSNYTHNGYGSYNFEGNSDAKELVYTVSENNFHNYNLNFNIEEGQKVIVNLTSSDAINFTNGSLSINGNKDDLYLRNNSGMITFNVVNSDEINVSSTAIYGNFLAPNSDLNGNAANICGTTVVNNLDAKNGFELHVPKPTPVPVITETPTVVPTPFVTPDPIVTLEPTVVPTPEPIVTETPTVVPTPFVTPAPIVTLEPTVVPTPEPIVTETPTIVPTPFATPDPIVTPDPVVTQPPQEDIPKTADITQLIMLKDLLLMSGAAYGAKKILTKKKTYKKER